MEPPRSSLIDTTRPSVARAYNAALGGKDNYEVDRQLLEQITSVVPELPFIATSNREFLVRAVRFLARDADMDQFLDCGSGLPTAENTHQIAQRVTPDARVVYVDNDPVVLAHGRALLEENENTRFIDADIFEPENVLENEDVRTHLDLTRPLVLMMVATLHHHNPDESPLAPAEIMRRYIDAIPSGSYVAFSHFIDPENEHTETAMRIQTITMETIHRGYFRKRAEIEEMIEGLDLVEPGLVTADDWWPNGPRQKPLPSVGHCIVAAVGRKP
ncbi:SAM-dependent methyltransferase [Actinokineospora guangxiensis]|uniref:SAM-dependent methyltransferase n=1 Tax=Actinokineospora guangxiensis TaxID=1490288 RepID=A0ABW0EKB4_9PSEU